MDRNPFDGLSLAETERLERACRRAHPFLWIAAELVVFVRDPPEWCRDWRRRKAIGYDGRPGRTSSRSGDDQR